MRTGSVSPEYRRGAHHRFSPHFDHSDGSLRGRGFNSGRDPGRYRDYSPPYGRGRNDGRFASRSYDRAARGPESIRVEGLPRNNPNVRPREGDWFCSDPLCKNMNFARRDHCYTCNKPRFGSPRNPRRGFPGPFLPPRLRGPTPPLDISPGRIMNDGYRSPPHSWQRDTPRDLRPAGPIRRQEGRFSDPLMRNNRHDHPEDDPRARDNYRYDRPILPDWANRDRGRGTLFNNRRGGYGRRVLSPPPAPPGPPHGGWASHIRDRSRSPVRGPKDIMYMNR